LLAGLFQAERRCPSLSDQQWVGLAEGLASVGDILLTKEAVAEAIARQPNSTIARALAAKTTLLERFGKPLSSTERRVEARATGIFSSHREDLSHLTTKRFNNCASVQ
jgi:hypothetical protein